MLEVRQLLLNTLYKSRYIPIVNTHLLHQQRNDPNFLSDRKRTAVLLPPFRTFCTAFSCRDYPPPPALLISPQKPTPHQIPKAGWLEKGTPSGHCQLVMQSMPLLLRQTLKTPGLSTFSRTTTTTSSTSTTTAARRPVRIPSAAPRSLFLHAGRGNQSTRGFSACRRCQFRSQQQNLFPSDGETEGRSKNSKVKEADGGEGAGRDRAREHHPHGPIMTLPQEGDFSKYGDVGAEGQKDTSTAGVNFENAQAMQGPEGDGPNGSEQKGGRLPSNLENRRSRYSKQFSEMMDNVQSNVFVAGQRLNDLTGYSSIEALKRDIQHQGKLCSID